MTSALNSLIPRATIRHFPRPSPAARRHFPVWRRFMTHVRVSAFCVAALLMTLPAASAQTTSGTTGAINGRVLDNTKAVLPGVTVTIASTAQMGTRTTTTNEEGQYRFPADRKSTRLNSSHIQKSRMPSSA